MDFDRWFFFGVTLCLVAYSIAAVAGYKPRSPHVKAALVVSVLASAPVAIYMAAIGHQAHCRLTLDLVACLAMPIEWHARVLVIACLGLFAQIILAYRDPTSWRY